MNEKKCKKCNAVGVTRIGTFNNTHFLIRSYPGKVVRFQCDKSKNEWN